MPDPITFEPPRADDGPLAPPTRLAGARQQTETASQPPRTEAVRRALHTRGGALAADLVFLEMWESQAPPDIAATLRAAQIRRANRGLAAEIRAELHHGRPLSESERAALRAEHSAGPR